MSDFEPKGEVARAYGAYRASEGTAERALFVVDEHGLIYWSYLSPVGVNPGADGILEALESLSKQRATSAASRATRSLWASTSSASGRSWLRTHIRHASTKTS